MQQAFICSSLPFSPFYLFCSKPRTCLPQRHELSPRLALYKTTQYSNNKYNGPRVLSHSTRPMCKPMPTCPYWAFKA